jgi:hypothetical protein
VGGDEVERRLVGKARLENGGVDRAQRTRLVGSNVKKGIPAPPYRAGLV